MGSTKPRRVEKPPIIATFDEEGYVKELIVKGQRFDPEPPCVPVGLLKDVKLEEIPEGVYVIPLEKNGEHVVHFTDLCKDLDICRVHLYGDHAYLEVWSCGAGWEFEIGIKPFMNMFVRGLRAVGDETKLIENVEYKVDRDWHLVCFTVPLNPEVTVEQAIEMIKRLFDRVKEVVEEMMVEFYEERLAAWRERLRARRGSGQDKDP